MTNFAADLHISIYTRTSFPSISSPWNSLIRLSLIIGMYPIYKMSHRKYTIWYKISQTYRVVP